MPGVHDDLKPQMTTQMYLKAVYLLHQEGQIPTLTRLAELLGVAPPTALAMVRRLTASGLVVVGRRKEVNLTAEGEAIARAILRRHHLAERLLGEVIGLAWHETHDEACRLEHAISPAVEERLYAILGRPATCPHGNPIDEPTALGPEPGAATLDSLDRVPVGRPVVVQGITELAETDPSFLAYLHAHCLVPGALVEVIRREPSFDILFVRRGQEDVALSLRAAARVRVQPAEPTTP